MVMVGVKMELNELNKLHDLFILNFKEEKNKVSFFIGGFSKETKYVLTLDIKESFDNASSIKTFYYEKGKIIGELEDDYNILKNYIIQITDVAFCTPNDLIFFGELFDHNMKLVLSPVQSSINISIRITKDITTSKSLFDYVKLSKY